MQHFSRIRDKSYAYLSKNDEYDRKLISPKPLENDAQITPEKKIIITREKNIFLTC